MGVVTNILQEDLDRISPQWSSLLTSLANLVSLTRTIGDVSRGTTGRIIVRRVDVTDF